ncbi:bifunctional 2',3'-cyclic-nucleotide 2'-phosphodiesterase/3'-nucleotidase [Thalassovita taeanensis]|uniref:2',3'-cyclic-nucleotide 2'-phosphodiesterase / 3'-nucleotidase n=1 Tax=Thalassovita taeanensis TaxID=657014 RepID=A0A1H9CLY5_9RHOB|nr:bifunctional 2',3'-cyclic-nucleotide 2'-phosphodiesterase/3'-nucleotidase [Thalassovita taeanensis]SEQ02222.1 2',3'-cyclic-nucleotide 2'-phosphodiesterase / 3'-nucleotidase [Thalassovita taeanensis]
MPRPALHQSQPPFFATAKTQIHLRILQTTDIHVHLLPYDYFADRPNDMMGLSRTASLIETARAEAANTLLLDTGDFLQGNPMGDHFSNVQTATDAPHPMIAAMNALDYDAGTLGNHEFNYGLPFLLGALASAAFPVVLANVARRLGPTPTEDEPLLPPYRIETRQLRDGNGQSRSLNIGLIGFVPPQIEIWDHRHIAGQLGVRDILETARAYVPKMKAEGADIIIALNHSGIGAAQESPHMENAGIPLAAIPGIDVVLCGHQHLTFPGPRFEGIDNVDSRAGTIHGKPAVMAGFWGSHLGVIDLALEQDSTGSWRAHHHATHLRPIYIRNDRDDIVPTTPESPLILRTVQDHHRRTLNHIRKPVGETAQPLHSYFSMVADDPSVQIVAQAQAWRVADLLRGTPHANLPLLSAAAPFKAGGHAGPEHFTDVPAGPLSLRNLADLYLFPNDLRAVRCSGAELAFWLERSVGLFNQMTPGAQDQPLLNSLFPCYNFDVIHGLSYDIDLSRPSRYSIEGALVAPGAQRISRLMWQGRAVDPAQEFIVATNSYRAGGGGGFAGTGPNRIVLDVPQSNREVLQDYVAHTGRIDMPPTPVWHFAPLPDTTATFDSAPRALSHLPNVANRRITAAGRGPGGHARFRLHL